MSKPDPRQHDEATAALYREQIGAEQEIRIAMDRVHHAAGDRRDYQMRSRPWGMSNADALRQATPEARERHARAVHEFGRLAAELARMDGIWRQYGWNRYFLVTNGTGHVHKDVYCSSCYPTTQYEWLVSLANQPVDDMIADWGERACTVCFPDAPANPRFREPCRRDREALAARAAEKDQQDAKKAAKNLADDEQFRADGSWVETVHGCIEVLRHEVELRDYYGNGPHPDHGAYVIAAGRATEVLLARESKTPGHGKTQAEISTIIERAIIRNRKDGARI
jgi:hypothetical protein